MSALHRSYDEKVPAFLNERPDDMIMTCMEAQALSLAEIEKLSEMTYTVCHSKYKVDTALLSFECLQLLGIIRYVCLAAICFINCLE